MRIAVAGGTGVLGRAVAAHARRLGHDVITLGRRAPEGAVAACHHRVDLVTGEGLSNAFAGVEVLIDATNAVRGARRLLVGGTQRLLGAARRANVRLYVGVSIVGIDSAPIGYYRTKVEQERVIAAGGVPWSLVRATQFHDLIAKFAAGRWGVTFVPRGVPVQPVDVRDVAEHLLDVAARAPAGRLPDFAGPHMRSFREFAEAWQVASGNKRFMLNVPLFGAAGRFLRGAGLCDPEAARGRRTFGEWLRERYGEQIGRRR